ncbi:MAG: hypothetical protein ACOY0T_03710 [Myxococcota bacterium]
MKIAWLLLPLVVSLAAQSRADGRESCTSAQQATAVGQIACELAHALPPAQAPLRVTVRAISSPLRMERANELAQRLARAVAGELGANARAEAASALAGGARVDTLVLNGELARDKFSVSAELFRASGKFWERFRPGERGASERAHATRALDAELASYLPPVPLVLTRIDKANLEEPSVALACGDVDADGGLEIVTVGRRRVQLGRIASGRFQVLRSRAWSELSDVAPSPLKDPIASASVEAAQRIRIGLSDRREAVVLDHELALVARHAGVFPWPGAGCVPFVKGGLGETRARCEQKPRADAGGPLDAITGARLTRRDGSAWTVLVSRRPSAETSLELDGKRIQLDGRYGAQLALADLDSDGRPELISSLDTLDPASDAVVVSTIVGDKLKEAFRVPTPNGVYALGTCPSYDNLLSPLLVATGNELWVLR